MFVIVLDSVVIAIGGLIGLIFKKAIKREIATAILKAVGLVVAIVGLAGILKSIVTIEQNLISTRYELILIVSLSLGTLIGEVLKLDARLHTFGEFMEKKFKGNMFAEGFIDGTLMFCIGAMAIIGPFEAANGNPTLMQTKMVLDGITAIVLSSTLGIGILFSSIAVFLYQGAFYVVFLIAGPIMSEPLVNLISATGYILIVCLGINFLLREKIKVVNMLPAILISILYYVIFL